MNAGKNQANALSKPPGYGREAAVLMVVHENKAAASSSRRRRDGPGLPHPSQEIRHIQPALCATDNSCDQCTLPTGRFYRSCKRGNPMTPLPPRGLPPAKPFFGSRSRRRSFSVGLCRLLRVLVGRGPQLEPRLTGGIVSRVYFQKVAENFVSVIEILQHEIGSRKVEVSRRIKWLDLERFFI
jgi:hypothetical protein